MDSALTTPALQTVTRLRRLAAALDAGEQPDPGDGAWLGQRLARYLADASRGLSVEMALDLSPNPGDAPWFEIERLDRRDELLLQITAKHFPGLSPPRASAALTAEWRQYERHAQAVDRQRGYSVAAPDTLRADLFRLTELGDLPGGRRLADILRASAEGTAA